MIYKDLDPFAGTDKYAIAGRRAEEQMAHYLKRFFASSQEIDALNYLRISLGDEVAQLDHLVLHPLGFTIVESKSVAGSVQIKDDGQWIRWFNKQPQGMRSPVIQAKMQAMLLRELLATRVKQRGFFDGVDIDVLVAISDNGTIQWPSSGPLPEVCKADQIPERIQLKINRRGGPPNFTLSAEHRRVIADFLRSIHRPLGGSIAVAGGPVDGSDARDPFQGKEGGESALEKSTGALPAKACRHCGGLDIELQHGRFGYYFACKACQKNTSIRFDCPKCGGAGRIRKQGIEFFAECKSCDASRLFHVNG